MAPKSPKKNMVEETMADMAKQLKTLTTTIQGNNTRMDSLEMLIKGLSAENNDLKKELVARDEEIFDLKSRINNMDQRHRSWSTRIFNIPLSKEEEGDNFQVMQAVYNNALLPILRGAVASKILSTVPTCEQVLETAHVLPGAADNFETSPNQLLPAFTAATSELSSSGARRSTPPAWLRRGSPPATPRPGLGSLPTRSTKTSQLSTMAS